MKTTEQIEQQDIGQKPKKNMVLMASAVLFATVCAISAFFFFENMRLDSSIEANKNEIAGYANSIAKLQSDKKVIAAEIVTNNKNEILDTIKTHEAQKYVTELLDVSRKFKMIFSGFSYENGKITTSAVSVPETVLAGDDGVRKISRFIKDYRTGSGYVFGLAPVLSISGYEQKRAFSIEFNVNK